MTREQCLQKIDELIDVDGKHHGSGLAYLREECSRLLRTGALSTEDYEDNFHLPKLVFMVALENVAKQYAPAAWDKGTWKEIRNLRKF